MSKADAAESATGYVSAQRGSGTARRILVLDHSGLGNSVILAPLLAAYSRKSTFWVQDSPLWAWLSANGCLGRLPIEESIGKRWRRIYADDAPHIITFLKSRGIDTLINLRLVPSEDANETSSLRDRIQQDGVAWFDRSSGADLGKCIGDQISDVLASALGAPSCDVPETWLAGRSGVQSGDHGAIYVGASEPSKMMPPSLWRQIAAQLAPVGREIWILAGRLPHEVAAAREVGLAMRDLTYVRALPIICDELPDLLSNIRALRFLVSCDTAAAHIARACGVPVLTLHNTTSAEIWGRRSPLSIAVQGNSSLHCVNMTRNGTCRRFYEGCEPKCVTGLSPPDVGNAVRKLREIAGVS